MSGRRQRRSHFRSEPPPEVVHPGVSPQPQSMSIDGIEVRLPDRLDERRHPLGHRAMAHRRTVGHALTGLIEVIDHPH